jgi:hypothetical protein
MDHRFQSKVCAGMKQNGMTQQTGTPSRLKGGKAHTDLLGDVWAHYFNRFFISDSMILGVLSGP